MRRRFRSLAFALLGTLLIPFHADAIGPRVAPSSHAPVAHIVRAPRSTARTTTRRPTVSSRGPLRRWALPLHAADLTSPDYTREHASTPRGSIAFGHGAVPTLDHLRVDAPMTAVQHQNFQRTRDEHFRRDIGTLSRTQYDAHGDPTQFDGMDLRRVAFAGSAKGTFARDADGALTTTGFTVTNMGRDTVVYTADRQGHFHDPKGVAVPLEQVVPRMQSGPVRRRVVTRVHRLEDGRVMHHDTIYNLGADGSFMPIETSVAIGRPNDPRVRPSVGHTLLDEHGSPLNTVWVDYGESTEARTIRAVVHAREGRPEQSYTFEADQQWHNEADARDVRDTAGVFGEMTWGEAPLTKAEGIHAASIGVGRSIGRLPAARMRALLRSVNLANYEAGDEASPAHNNCVAASMTTFSALASNTKLGAVLHPDMDPKHLEHATGREMVPMTVGSVGAWPWRGGPGGAINFGGARIGSSGHELMARAVGATDGLSPRGTQVLDGQSAQDEQQRADGRHDLLTSFGAGFEGMYLGPARTVRTRRGEPSTVPWHRASH